MNLTVALTNGRQSIMINEMVGYCALLFYFIFGSCTVCRYLRKRYILSAGSRNGEDEEEVVEHSADASRLSRSIKVVKTRR